MIADVRSVVCVPWWGQDGSVAGLLYADSRIKQGLFGNPELAALQQIARQLEETLGGRRPARPAPSVAPARRAARAPVPAPGSLRRASLPYLFRCLATLLGAGVSLLRALEVLGQGSEDQQQSGVMEAMSGRIRAGQSLAAAMAAHPGAFSAFHLRLVGLGEVTGSLHRSLEHLAEYEERTQALWLEFKRTLTYPAVLLAVCLVMLVLIPPLALSAQLELARQSGAQLPWISRAVAGLSDALRHPAGQLLIGSGLVLLGLSGYRLRGWFWRVPVLAGLLRARALAVFAQALSHLLEAGIPLTQALPQAAACPNLPELEAHVDLALVALLEGQSLAGALRAGEFFPRSFVAVLEVGEESGELPQVLRWLGHFYEQQARDGLESLAAWLEPVIMMGMGVVVGMFLLATMIPMASALANL